MAKYAVYVRERIIQDTEYHVEADSAGEAGRKVITGEDARLIGSEFCDYAYCDDKPTQELVEVRRIGGK